MTIDNIADLQYCSITMNAPTTDTASETRKQIVTRFAPLLRAAERRGDIIEEGRLLVERARLLDRSINLFPGFVPTVGT